MVTVGSLSTGCAWMPTNSQPWSWRTHKLKEKLPLAAQTVGGSPIPRHLAQILVDWKWQTTLFPLTGFWIYRFSIKYWNVAQNGSGEREVNINIEWRNKLMLEIIHHNLLFTPKWMLGYNIESTYTHFCTFPCISIAVESLWLSRLMHMNLVSLFGLGYTVWLANMSPCISP